MKRTSGRRAIGEILNMLHEEEHISEDFKHFIDQCLSDYLHSKKLSYSLYSIIKHNTEIVDIPKVKEALAEIAAEECSHPLGERDTDGQCDVCGDFIKSTDKKGGKND